jgi:hypothetical protein
MAVFFMVSYIDLKEQRPNKTGDEQRETNMGDVLVSFFITVKNT